MQHFNGLILESKWMLDLKKNQELLMLLSPLMKMMSKRKIRRQQMDILYSHLMCWMQGSKEFDRVPTGSTTMKLWKCFSPARSSIVGPTRTLGPGSWPPGGAEILAGGLFLTP